MQNVVPYTCPIIVKKNVDAIKEVLDAIEVFEIFFINLKDTNEMNSNIFLNKYKVFIQLFLKVKYIYYLLAIFFLLASPQYSQHHTVTSRRGRWTPYHSFS